MARAPYELPQVCIDGVWYYVDERLTQIRRVDNPHDYRSFADAEAMWEFVNDGWEG